MRERAAAASVALLALLLAGCAAIPSAGPVQPGDPVVAERPADLDFLADSPVPGASQRQILEGFLDAAVSPAGDYRVAREYLTTDFSDTWVPQENATIDVLADREIIGVDESTMRIDATPAASLRGNGQYEEPESRTAIPLEYRFTQVDDEWRISSAPPGLLIDQVSFTQVFNEYTLYFFDPTYRYFVPDVRWYAGRESAQTSIVRAMIAGPAEWLVPGVRSAFPEGVQLDPAAVPVSGRTADVSLEGAALDDILTVQRIQAQLDATLIGVRNIDSVALSVNGADPDASALSPEPVKTPRVDPRPVVFDGELFGYLASSGDRIVPIEGLSEQVAALTPIGAAVGPDAEAVALLNDAGVWLVRTDEGQVRLDPRPGLITPAIDREGIVWSVPAASPDQLVWFGPDGAPHPIEVPWSGSTIASIEVSRDGTRIVALLGDGARTHFVAASIQRDGDGMPTEALGSVPLRLANVSGTPLDVAWLDSRRVASLTTQPDGTTRLVTQELGGFASERDGPAGGVLVDGGNAEMRVLTADGGLEAQSGVGWQVRASDIRFIAAQQPR
jgi:hypothetical protein